MAVARVSLTPKLQRRTWSWSLIALAGVLACPRESNRNFQISEARVEAFLNYFGTGSWPGSQPTNSRLPFSGQQDVEERKRRAREETLVV